MTASLGKWRMNSEARRFIQTHEWLVGEFLRVASSMAGGSSASVAATCWLERGDGAHPRLRGDEHGLPKRCDGWMVSTCVIVGRRAWQLWVAPSAVVDGEHRPSRAADAGRGVGRRLSQVCPELISLWNLIWILKKLWILLEICLKVAFEYLNLARS